MSRSNIELQKITVASENCVLHITYTGSGSSLLLMIPGGHGLGSNYHAVLPRLANSTKYTVATYDRRGHGESRFTPSGEEINETMNPAQSARDILAVIRHFGFEKADIFGTSMGGVIAFQFAIQFPQHVEKLIAHESPTMTLLPGEEGTKWIDWAFSVFRTYKTAGPKKAMVEFLSMTVGWKATSSGAGADIPPPQSEDEIEMDRDHLFWFENEYTLSVFTPNLLELKRHLVGKYKDTLSVAVTVGKNSGDAPYAKTTYVHEEILSCQHHMWPGGHLLYLVDPQGFVKVFLDTLEKLERKQ
ncbi:hypothetical protein H2200_000146 [Cladophialophora chaetospira]|uniref:AB hydrolase-1 domain-containing protein n=1 Tax=Cladophialophora chaetospira TaxID=386627 RepID=A0AA38XMV7_9EURO|nr:hypothetical protein H2200_000146 [Cladophialophora chaetospira]